MFADLHLHTRFSDGTYTPEELVASARHHGLSAIAVTDHDTMEGCAPTAVAAGRVGLAFIPGIELTTEFEGRELHLLGYLLDAQEPELAGELLRAQEVRQNRVREMVERLHASGIPLPLEQVFSLAECRAPGRPHVARALVAAGFCTDLDQAFERYLKKDRPAWVPKPKMTMARAIELIHRAGGVAVMAHPALNHDDGLIERVAPLGLDGLECFHPKHQRGHQVKYQDLAVKLGLLVTGGSDCHGRSKNRATMGSVRMPLAVIDTLRSRQSARRAPASPPAPEPGSPPVSS